jgi:hypothetical protein
LIVVLRGWCIAVGLAVVDPRTPRCFGALSETFRCDNRANI